MSSVDSRLLRKLNAFSNIRVARTDTPVVLRLRNKSGGAVTSVTVTAATNIVIVTANGGTDTYAFSTYSTVGLLADAINADGIFEARVLDALRSDATASLFIDGAITAGTTRAGVRVWDVKQDTSASFSLTACAHVDRDFGFVNDSDMLLQRCAKVKFLKYGVNMGTAAVDSVLLVTRNGSAETTLLSELSVDTTETTTYTGVGDESAFIGGRAGEELVYRVKDAATLNDATSNYVRIDWITE